MASKLNTFRNVTFRGVVIGNDIFTVALPWIISPSFGINTRYAQLSPSPWFFTIVYSTLEPLAERALISLGANPESVCKFFALSHITSVLLVFECAFDILGVVLPNIPDDDTDKTSVVEKGIQEEEDMSPPAPQDPAAITIRHKTRIHCIYLLPLLTSSVTNAALILWTAGANPGKPLIVFLQTINLILEPVWVIGMYWFFDWTLLAGLAGRARWLGEKVNGQSAIGTQFGCLLLNLGIRFGIRILLGIDPLLAFRHMDEETWKGMRVPWLSDLLKTLNEQSFVPALTKPLRNAPFLSLIVFKYWAIRRNDRRRTALEMQIEASNRNDKSMKEHRPVVEKVPKDKQLFEYLEDPVIWFGVTLITPDLLFVPVVIVLFVCWIKGRRQRRKTSPADEEGAKQPEHKPYLQDSTELRTENVEAAVNIKTTYLA